MKTNQLMHVRIGEHVLPIEHKTMMGSLTDVWRIGNTFRIQKGLNPLDLNNFLRTPETLEFVQALEYDLGIESKYVGSTGLVVDGRIPSNIKSDLIKTKRGKGGGTWAHLYILLDAAGRLDASFRLEMYKTFVAGKILQWRDDSGDEFIQLNIAIDAYLPERDGRDNTGIYIQCAKMLKAKINPDGDSWNTASQSQLQKRYDIEKRLVDLLRLGVIRNFEHLKEIIQKI